MTSPAQQLNTVREQIAAAESRFNRQPGSVRLLAVSKTRTAEEIRATVQAGQRLFGESYLQEALNKIDQLQQEAIEWHFIGRIQSNKTKLIAEHFDWVHSLDNLKHARRLNEQRPEHLPPLNVCLQINISQEASKGGIEPDALADFITAFDDLPRLHLCGLMVIPAPADSLEAQRAPFRQLRELRDQLATTRYPLHTLSMGMSGDLEAAVAEGSTIVRVGTAIFGPRNYANQTTR